MRVRHALNVRAGTLNPKGDNMSIQHPVFLRRMGSGKVMVVTVVDEESLNIPEDLEDGDCFGIAVTSNNIYTGGNPQTTIHSIVGAEQYCKDISEHLGYDVQSPRGMGISGVMTSPYWCIIPMQTVHDMMGG
jgi:hypothetical protein